MLPFNFFSCILVMVSPCSQLLLPVKHELEVLPEPARVVVAQRLGIAKGLEQGVRLQENVLHAFDRRCVRWVPSTAAHGRDVVLNLFGGFGFPRARLAADDHALALFFADHLAVRRFRHPENVRRGVDALLVHVVGHLAERNGLNCVCTLKEKVHS